MLCPFAGLTIFGFHLAMIPWLIALWPLCLHKWRLIYHEVIVYLLPVWNSPVENNKHTLGMYRACPWYLPWYPINIPGGSDPPDHAPHSSPPACGHLPIVGVIMSFRQWWLAVWVVHIWAHTRDWEGCISLVVAPMLLAYGTIPSQGVGDFLSPCIANGHWPCGIVGWIMGSLHFALVPTSSTFPTCSVKTSCSWQMFVSYNGYKVIYLV